MPAGTFSLTIPCLEAIVKYLTTTTKNSGKDLVEHFRKSPFGWPQDLIGMRLPHFSSREGLR